MEKLKITKENLVQVHKETIERLEELREKTYQYKLIKVGKKIIDFSNMSYGDLISAYLDFHKNSISVKEAMDDLDIPELYGKRLDDNFTTVLNQFKTRVQELKDNTEEEYLEQAVDLMEKHLPENNDFEEDSKLISELLSGEFEDDEDDGNCEFCNKKDCSFHPDNQK